MKSALLGNKHDQQPYPFGAIRVGPSLRQWDCVESGRPPEALLLSIEPSVGFTAVYGLWTLVRFSENIRNVKPQAEFSIYCKHSHSEHKNSPL